MSWPRPIRVVGVGSPLGDDAVAWEIVRRSCACLMNQRAHPCRGFV